MAEDEEMTDSGKKTVDSSAHQESSQDEQEEQSRPHDECSGKEGRPQESKEEMKSEVEDEFQEPSPNDSPIFPLQNQSEAIFAETNENEEPNVSSEEKSIPEEAPVQEDVSNVTGDDNNSNQQHEEEEEKRLSNESDILSEVNEDVSGDTVERKSTEINQLTGVVHQGKHATVSNVEEGV